MKALRNKISILLLCVLLVACDSGIEQANSVVEQEPLASDGRASFSMRNGEIRDDMIRMLDEAGIIYRIGEGNAIIYRLEDGEAIDKIGNEAISEYITRN